MGQKTHPKGFRLVTTQKHLSKWYAEKFDYALLINEDNFIRSEIEKCFKDNLSISKIEINRILQEDKINEYVNINIYSLFPRAKEMSRKIGKFFPSNSSSFETKLSPSSKVLNDVNIIKPEIKKLTDKLEKEENITLQSVVSTNVIQTSLEKKEEGIELEFPKTNVEKIEQISEKESSSDLTLFSLKNMGTLTNSKENLKIFTSFVLKRNIRELTRFLQLKTKKNYFVNLKFIKNPFEDAVLIAKYIADQLEKRTPFRRAVKQTIKKVQRTEIKGIKIQLSGRLNGIDIARSEWKREGKIPLHTLKAYIDYTHEIAHTIYGVIGIKIWLFKGI